MTYSAFAELKQWLSIGTADTTDDVSLTIAHNDAYEAINDFCDRTFDAAGTVAEPRYFAATDGISCRIDDIGNLTDLVVETDLDFDGTYETLWTGADFQVQPINNIDKDKPVYSLLARASGSQRFPVSGDEALVKVTARWGWPLVPAKVKGAEIIQAARFHSRRRAPLGSIQAPELGGGERLLSKLDPDVELSLVKFRRSWNGLET